MPSPVMGLIAQPSLEDADGIGISNGSDAAGYTAFCVSITYTLWRNPPTGPTRSTSPFLTRRSGRDRDDDTVAGARLADRASPAHAVPAAVGGSPHPVAP
ncbi:hypothetical protein [Leekyejoonella antrihumi]|uniref:Uncharacterized protein n=1 Tax=Leekyejoonella antrihumi TaxID=1660198 RepID=A0A563E3S4_9MICO|nr:hypothetical protein [Leekyejoonella antrihumi]TWP36534.1 hypothetical protein FGL98_10015 [Leekyejoonella antrihumi]